MSILSIPINYAQSTVNACKHLLMNHARWFKIRLELVPKPPNYRHRCAHKKSEIVLSFITHFFVKPFFQKLIARTINEINGHEQTINSKLNFKYELLPIPFKM